MKNTRRERLRMKRSIRDKMIAAAERSADCRIFGYSFVVTDPQPIGCFDPRRKAFAHVDFDEQKIYATFSDDLQGEEICVDTCHSKEKLTKLARLAWHPSVPIPDVIEGAMVMLDILRNAAREGKRPNGDA